MFTSHLLFQRAETALLGEKANKLFGITKYLDSCLGDLFNDCFKEGQNKEEIVREIFETLAPVVDKVCDSFKGLGAGYYSRKMVSFFSGYEI